MKNVIELTGEVGWEITYEDIIQKCDPEKENYFIINSYGGEVYEGFMIAEYIKSLELKTTALIKTECASIATVIALACDEVIMEQGSFFMIHNPYVAWLTCDADCLEETVIELREIEDKLANIYEQATGKTIEEIKKLMKEETFFSPDEALQFNFINEVVENLYNYIMNLSNEKKEEIVNRVKKAGRIDSTKKEKLKTLVAQLTDQKSGVKKELEELEEAINEIRNKVKEEILTKYKNK